MKKLGLIMVLLMLVSIVGVSAQTSSAMYWPLPINGKLEGINVNNQEVQITNLRTNAVQTTYTTEAGEFLVDAANFDDLGGTVRKYDNGDQFEVKITACASASACVKVLTYTGQVELFAVYDLSGVTLSCPACPTCNCGGGGGSGGYSSCKSCCDDDDVECPDVTCPSVPTCPEIPTDTTPYDSCSSCCSTTDCPDKECPSCPVVPSGTDPGILVIMAIGMVLSAGAGVYFTRNKVLGKRTGIKIYKKLDGTNQIQHKHPGIRGYHDPSVVHKDSWERHPKGQVYPEYQKHAIRERYEYVN